VRIATRALWVIGLAAGLVASSEPARAGAAPPPTSSACADEPRLHALDFWLGDWDVFSGNDKDGTNRIRSILHGCAVEELWRDVQGGEGRSLFYFDRASNRWKQVWVTEQGLAIGGTKEKVEQVELTTPTSVRFEGSYPGRSGVTVLDRTTLTRNPDRSVRQLIEVSLDDGATWRATFDAVYRPRKSAQR
jgi:hypothetical protein